MKKLLDILSELLPSLTTYCAAPSKVSSVRMPNKIGEFLPLPFTSYLTTSYLQVLDNEQIIGFIEFRNEAIVGHLKNEQKVEEIADHFEEIRKANHYMTTFKFKPVYVGDPHRPALRLHYNKTLTTLDQKIEKVREMKNILKSVNNKVYG